MRRLSPGSLAGGLGLVLLVATATGCHKPADASADLANAVKVLEQVPAGQPAPPQGNPNGQGSPPASQQVNEALTAYKGGSYADAIGCMELARLNPNKTPAQTMAIQDAMAAVMADLYTRAAKGDVAAQRAIAQYQENRNKR